MLVSGGLIAALLQHILPGKGAKLVRKRTYPFSGFSRPADRVSGSVQGIGARHVEKRTYPFSGFSRPPDRVSGGVQNKGEEK